MASEIEQDISAALRRLLNDLSVGEHVPDSEQFKRFLRRAERLIDFVLRDANDGWDDHCDGIAPVAAIKTGETEIALLGYYYLLADQAVVPFYACIQAPISEDKISWIACGIGEKGPTAMRREPSTSLGRLMNQVYVIEGWTEPARWPTLIDWAYVATLGERFA